MARSLWLLYCATLVTLSCSGETVPLAQELAVAGASGSPPPFSPDDDVQQRSQQLDLLFVVDNSIGTQDTQHVLVDAVPDFLNQLINPPCVAPDGSVAPVTVASADDPCPEPLVREQTPARDIHFGVITSSLGAHGGDACVTPDKNDRGRLLGSLDRGRAVQTYSDLGFLKYAPSDPAAHDSPSLFAAAATELLQTVGFAGCGFESTLEAAYRFLADPAPPLDTSLDPATQETQSVGIDTAVLEARARFLRPNSALQVVIVSDENDCSIKGHGRGWQLTTGSQLMARATSVCAADPSHACCQSCSEPLRPGCPALEQDPECVAGRYTLSQDPLNLRCFDVARRFGSELLYPTSRYAVAFSDPELCPDSPLDDLDCKCRLAIERGASRCEPGAARQNPLFEGGRHRSLVSVAAVVGVPWQYLVREPPSDGAAELLSVPELRAQGRAALMIGAPRLFDLPIDPFMQESVGARSGVSPITGDPIVGVDAGEPAAINGHEYIVAGGDDLQYTCVWPIAPRDCSGLPETWGCPCEPQRQPELLQTPLCQAPTGNFGTVQYHGRAYPGLRQLELVDLLGGRGVAGPACPMPASPGTANAALRPALRAVRRRIRELIE